MSKISKIWTVVIVVVVIVIIVMLYIGQSNINISDKLLTTTENSTSTLPAYQSNIASSTDVSDTALDEDLLKIDIQMNNLNNDSANIDKNLK